MFLLDLASTGGGGRSTDDETYLKSGPWVVSEFKCLANLEASVRQQSDTNDAILLQLRDQSSVVRADTVLYHKIIKYALTTKTISEINTSLILCSLLPGNKFRPR